MSTSAEPTRFRDGGSGAPSRLRELFDAAAREQPTPTQLARLEAKLAPLLGDAPAPAPATSTMRLSSALKFGLGMLAIGGVGVVVALSARDAAKDADESTTAPSASVAPPAPEASVPAADVRPPVAASEARPATSPPLTPPSPAESTSPVRPLPAAREGAPPRPAAPPSGLSEDQLLEKARAALRLDPGLALRLTREHQQRFSGGILTQEREVIAIEALRRLGRSVEADQRAQRFEQRYPGSAHQRKLDTPRKQ